MPESSRAGYAFPGALNEFATIFALGDVVIGGQ
jgi:hypothetical protein